MPARFELFAFWRTSATYRVRVAMNLKGLEAEEKQVNLIEGQQHDPAFLKVNPMAAIPALVDRADGAPGEAMTQSLAILEFLEEVAPSPAILPSDPYGRARVRSLSLLLAADTHPFITPRVRKYLGTMTALDDATWKAWQANWIAAGLQGLEKRLAEPGTGRFCHGDTPGMADICMASIIVVARVFGIGVPGIPTVERIMAACEALPAFAKADPRRQVGAPPG